MRVSEQSLRLEAPGWMWPLVSLTILISTWTPLSIYLNTLGIKTAVTAAVIAIPLWALTTYRQTRLRRVLPGYIGLLLSLILQIVELLIFGHEVQMNNPVISQLTLPTVWVIEIEIGIVCLGWAALLLFASAGIFFHHPVGNYGAWLACSLAVLGGLSRYSSLLVASGPSYVPGMFSGCTAMILGLLVGTQMFCTSRKVGQIRRVTRFFQCR